MQFFNAFFVQWQFFLQWLEGLGFLNPINQEESVPESSPVAIQMEQLPTTIQKQSLPNDIKTESLQVVIQTVNVSQQTDVLTETKKASVLEEKLTEQVNDLKRQLAETEDVSEERKCKTQKLEKDLGIMAAQHKLEIAKINRKRSQEVIFKEIELIQIQDDCDNRIADLELSNAKLMEIIVELETKQTPVLHTFPSSETAIHRKFDESVARIESIQEHLSSLDVVTEHSRWALNYALELIKDDITSGTSDDQQVERLRASTEEVNCKPTVTTRDVGCGTEVTQFPEVQRIDVGCDTVDLPPLPSSKGKDVGCNTIAFPPLPSTKVKDVGCGTGDFPLLPTIIKVKSQRAGEKSAAESEQRPKHQALFSEKVKGKGKAEVVKQPEDKPDSDVRCKNQPIESSSHNPVDGTTQVHPEPHKKATPPEPAPGFTIISKEIKQTEHRDMLILSDIHQTLYGRVVGRGGENVKRMQMSHGVSMSMVKSKTHEEFCNMIIRGGNPEKHQAAAREILESLPVTIECPANVNLKRLGTPEFKKLINPLFVKITRPTAPNGKATISGRINNCRKAYELLVKDDLPPGPAK